MLFRKLLPFALFIIFSSQANAKEIAIINVDKIVQESKVMVHIQKEVSKKQEFYQKQITTKQNTLEDKQKKLEAKKALLSEDSLEEEAKKFQEEVLELKKFVDKRQSNLQKASLGAMEVVNDEIKEIVAEISQEQDIKVIIPASQTLYFQDSIDISSLILERLNKKLTKVKVKFDSTN